MLHYYHHHYHHQQKPQHLRPSTSNVLGHLDSAERKHWRMQHDRGFFLIVVSIDDHNRRKESWLLKLFHLEGAQFLLAHVSQAKVHYTSLGNFKEGQKNGPKMCPKDEGWAGNIQSTTTPSISWTLTRHFSQVWKAYQDLSPSTIQSHAYTSI
jgi:hypothetical protein